MKITMRAEIDASDISELLMKSQWPDIKANLAIPGLSSTGLA